MGAENCGPNVKFVQKELGQRFYAFSLGNNIFSCGNSFLVDIKFLVVNSTKYNMHVNVNVMRPVNYISTTREVAKDQRVQC
ncbi:hypothetical protein TorRG33x02_141200 [Trema orientale]|uniref:Uncharacterized protein n=1 Tax=Trema orientale TaxID=63057 RepID=A0A2P5EX23_TREOI|nr:hypothetical protein TorRG33x02_141200 [Trema orientale]